VLSRVTKHITRLWGHRKNVADSNNPGQTKSVQVYEVKITERTLENLKDAVKQAEERINACRNSFGKERVEDLDNRVNERRFTQEEQAPLSKALPRLQIWPGSREGECQLKIFAFEVRNLPEPTPAVLDASGEQHPNDLPLERGGFDGLGSLFG